MGWEGEEEAAENMSPATQHSETGTLPDSVHQVRVGLNYLHMNKQKETAL